MTLLAIGAEFSCMHVLCAMTLVASGAEFLFADHCRMAGVAVDFDVFADQNKFGIAVVIEFIRFPCACIVALTAVFA